MKRILNTVMIIAFMIAKVQGVYAQESLVTTKINTKEIVTKINNQVLNPSIIASVISIDPYEYSRQRKVDQKMAIYKGEIETERAKQEEERRQKESKKKVVLASYNVSADNRSDFSGIYQSAASKFGIEWQLLRAVHLVETGGRGNTTVASYAGAQGPMQFMPATFKSYAIDGDGDGATNVNDVDDAIFTAAHYLARNKAATDTRNALYRYNHSNSYIEKVLGIARGLGFSK